LLVVRPPFSSGSRPAGTRRWLILLVEDLVDARELYAEYLTYAGFSVATAINGHEAVSLTKLLRPDLILMDVRLPGMDGLEATADLKADPDVAHIPIVAITADPSSEVEERAREAGCSAVIMKPALPDEVARQIIAILAGVPRSDQ
jgi:two-component system cell cycle response regulator DivK